MFDGTPPSPWVVLNWDGRLLMSGNSDPTTGGSSTHSHGSFSSQSSTPSPNLRFNIQNYTEVWEMTTTVLDHRHQVSFNLADADHTPPYVSLIPAYLPQDLWSWTTYTKTYSGSVTLASRNTRNAAFGIYLIRPGFRSLNSDLAVRNRFTRNYSATTVNLKRYHKPFSVGAFFFKTLRMIYAAGIMLNPPPLIGRTYAAGIRIVNPNLISPPNVTVIDTLLKSFIHQFDKVQQQLQLMHLRHRLDLATCRQLDSVWGQAFQLPRYADEPDDVYRKRLMLHTLTIIACGTRQGCEEVLGYLVEDPGSVRVETEWPATVRVHFDSDKAVRNADYYRGMLEYLRTRLFAAGVDVVYHITYKDLIAGIRIRGTCQVSYRGNVLLGRRYLRSYTSSSILTRRRLAAINARVATKQRLTRQLISQLAARKALSVYITGKYSARRTIEIGYSSNSVMRKTCQVQSLVMTRIARKNIEASVVSRTVLLRKHISPFFGAIRLELRGGTQYGAGIRIVRM
ncbi:MAG: hypothetical protein N3G75_06330 [Methanothrix sp.]|nr:hypothetical protein [Methanothrix sp.]MCX8207432.1 hypothetical protein [Methanothrix sp.]